ncbi:recombinase family protein [Devosia sp. A449]
MTAPPLAYSYVRMSTLEQLKGDSLRRQVDASGKYAQDHGLRLVEDFKLHDIGVSAFKGANAAKGALSVFLAAVQAGEIPRNSYLLVESLDRLSREKIRPALQLLWAITQAGINVVTLSDGQVYRAGEDNLQSLIYSIVVMSRANEESHIKSVRVAAAWEKKRANIGTKKLTKHAPAWLRLSDDGTQFVLDSSKGDLVRRMFDLALEGMGPHSIVRMLNSQGSKPFGRSEGWHSSYVEKILKNRAVVGEFQPHRVVDGVSTPVGEPIKGYFPAVISEDKFLLVQVARRGRATLHGGRKGNTYQNIFSHIATCAYCGAKMRLVNKGARPQGGKYLKCSNAIRKLGCDVQEGWRYDHFEEAFFTFTREVNLTELLRSSDAGGRAHEFEQEITAIEERLRLLTARRDKTYDLIDQSSVSVAYLRDRLEETQSEIELVTDQLTKAKEALASASDRQVPAEEVTEGIKLLQHATGDEAFALRARLADRLSRMVLSLKLSVRGRAVNRAQMSDFLDVHEPDAAYRSKLLAHMAERDRVNRLDEPTFTVALIGGEARVVTVDRSNSQKLIQTAEVDENAATVIHTEFGTKHFSKLTPDDQP